MKLLSVLFLSFGLIFSSCGSGEDDENSENLSDSTNEQLNEKQTVSAQNVFNNIPDPGVLNNIITNDGIEYDGAMLNDPDKYSKYSTDDYKALNLGVYGTDLSYTSVFENSTESLVFLKAVNQLCKGLGISGVFDEKTSDRIEANKQNRDSLLEIITQSFHQADKFLKENQRPHTSALLVAGGWIEGIYLSSTICNTYKSKKVLDEMVKQKASLKDLIALIESYQVGEETKYVLDELKALQTPFEKMTTAADTMNKTAPVDPIVIKEVQDKISSLRKKITQN